MNVCSVESLLHNTDVVVRLDSKSEQFFVCYYNSMNEYKLKLFELSVLGDVFQRLENLAPSIAIY